jgi:hypothetical protein
MAEEDAQDDPSLVRIYLALSVKEGRRVEELFDALGIEYTVRVETIGRTLLGSARRAAAFLIDAAQADACEQALVKAGLGSGIVRGSG